MPQKQAKISNVNLCFSEVNFIMSSTIQSSIIRHENAHNQNIWASTWSHGDLITGK